MELSQISNWFITNPLLWLPQIIALIVVIIVWYFNPLNSPRLRWATNKVLVKMLENFGANYKVVSATLVTLDTDILFRKDKAYLIDMQRAIFDSKNRPTLMYDVDSAQPLSTEEMGNPKAKKEKIGKASRLINPSYVDAGLFATTLRTRIWQKILGSEIERFLLLIVICMAVGLVAVAGISIWKISELTKEIAKGVTVGG